MPESAYAEERCERCQTSFAPGTKRCIHCGGPIGRRLLALDALARPGAAGGGAPREPSAPDEQPAFGRIFRFAMIALVAVTAIARACFEAR